jgi:predicted DNA-binding transcriptional regulator YafY
MEVEGTAMRPGPRPVFAPELLRPLRQAIVAFRMVDLSYEPPEGAPYHVAVCPYGVLRGGRGWLVAHTEANPSMHLWRLDRIREANVLEQGFVRRDFDLRAYAAQSFGTFQEPPIEAVLRIAPEAAEAAQTWLFHPSQVMTREADGSLLVRFRAGGAVEMCWHFFTWGETLTIVTPKSLRDQMANMAREAARHHGARTKT